MKRLKIFLHGHCFDGAASAALFGRFYSARQDAEIVYVPKTHARGRVFSDDEFDADEHAIVDFRYAPTDRLTWWFDHHTSAFQPKEDEAHFATRPRDRFFFDPNARSCTKLLAESLARTHRWDSTPFAELVGWADVIDGAQFESAAQAVALAEPALQLMTFVDENQDDDLGRRFIDALTRTSLSALAGERWITRTIAPVRERNAHAETILRARADVAHGGAGFDLLDEDLSGYNKFLPYLVAPEAKYVVAIFVADRRVRVSVGSNPWNRPAPLVNLARICERYGGGGHAYVGGITLPADAIAEARVILAEIVGELRAL